MSSEVCEQTLIRDVLTRATSYTRRKIKGLRYFQHIRRMSHSRQSGKANRRNSMSDDSNEKKRWQTLAQAPTYSVQRELLAVLWNDGVARCLVGISVYKEGILVVSVVKRIRRT